MEIREYERIDDLLTHQLKIIQSDQVFSFSMDAVLLARFCSVPARGRILDLCTGNGVIPLLLSTRTKAWITGVEIQERLYDMAVRSVELNGLESRIHLIRGDLRTLPQTMECGSFDAITVNPPYLPIVAGERSANPSVAAARHEIHCTLEDVVSVSGKLIRAGGKVTMVHRPSRLVDVVSLLRAYRLEPKRIRFVHPRVDQESNMMLVEALKDGKAELRQLPPLIVYERDGQYCQELKDIYFGKQPQLADVERDSIANPEQL